MSGSVHLRLVPVATPPTICDVCPERPTCTTPCSRLQELIGPSTLSAYRELSVDALRQSDTAAAPVETNETYDRSIRLAQLAPYVRDAVEMLPPIQRLVVEAVFFDRQSERAVAEQIGADKRFVRRLLNIAFASLRMKLTALEKSGVLDGRTS